VCPPGTDAGENLQDALNAANTLPGPDRVEIGPGTFDSSSSSGFQYSPSSASNSVDVVGAGRGQTTLTSSTGLFGSAVIGFPAASSSTVSQLSVRLVVYQTGVYMKGGVVHDVDVALAAGVTANYNNGITLFDATVRDSSVTFPLGATTSAGVLGADGTNEVDDVVLYGGRWGVEAYVNTTVHRSRITSLFPVEAYQAPVTLDDSLLIATAQGTGYTPAGIDVTDQNGDNTGEQASVNASNVTIIAGDANSTGYGVSSHVEGLDDQAEVQIVNSIVRGFPTAFHRAQSNGGAAYLSAIDNNSTGGSDPGVTDSGHNGADPHFVDATAGDYRLRSDSPLIDAGTLHGSGANSDTDLDGQPRYVTAHGDNSRDVDFGAFEYQHRAPVAVAAASPAHRGPDQEFAFTAAGSSDPDAGDTIAYAWSFDDGAAASGQDVQHAFATAGDHTATLTVTDPTGLSTTSTATVTVDVPQQGTPGDSGAPGTPNTPSGPGAVQLVPKLELSGKPKVTGTSISFTVICIVGPCSVDSTAKSALRHRKSVTVARRSVTLATGERRKIKLTLTRGGRKLLAKYGKLPVQLSIKLRQPGARSLTIARTKLTFRKKRH
jgi:hypothetical protein